jgi:hypothetical protein
VVEESLLDIAAAACLHTCSMNNEKQVEKTMIIDIIYKLNWQP